MYLLFGMSRRPSPLKAMPIRTALSAVKGSQLGDESQVTSACWISRGEAADVDSSTPQLLGRCVSVSCLRGLRRNRGTTLPRGRQSPSSPFESHDSCCEHISEQIRRPPPKACDGFCPLMAPVSSIGEGLSFSPLQRVVQLRRAYRLLQLIQRSCVCACRPLIIDLPDFCWAAPLKLRLCRRRTRWRGDFVVLPLFRIVCLL